MTDTYHVWCPDYGHKGPEDGEPIRGAYDAEQAPRWERAFVNRWGNCDGYRFSDFRSGCADVRECVGVSNYCANTAHPDSGRPLCERECACELCPCVEIDIEDGDEADYSEGDQPILVKDDAQCDERPAEAKR